MWGNNLPAKWRQSSNLEPGVQVDQFERPDPTLEVDKVMIKASHKEVDKMLVNTYPHSVVRLNLVPLVKEKL